MKSLETPRKGKTHQQVTYPSRFGQVYRDYIIPHDAQSEAQLRTRRTFALASRGYGVTLTDLQRDLWIAAALNAPSHPWLGQYGHLSGQQLFVKINSVLRCVGQAPVIEPPAPVVFAPSPVGQLTIVNDDEAGIRLLLNVGAMTEDIMLFGQAPCSAGRSKRRRVCYLGLLPAAANGQCDITAQYTARFGQPAPGQKVFILTCQQKNGWKGRDQVTSAIVPSRSLPASQLTLPAPQAPKADASGPTQLVAAGILPAVEPGILPGGMGSSAVGSADPGGKMPPSTARRMPAATEAIPSPQQAPQSSLSPSLCAVYKGSSPGARGVHSLAKREHPVNFPGASLVHNLWVAMGRLFTLSRIGAAAR